MSMNGSFQCVVQRLECAGTGGAGDRVHTRSFRFCFEDQIISLALFSPIRPGACLISMCLINRKTVNP